MHKDTLPGPNNRMKFTFLFLLIPPVTAWLALREPAPEMVEPVPAIVAAAERGDLPRIDQLLSQQAEVNSRDFCRWTPLMKAALNGHEP
ncbi:MAG: ankyrin repeat domain-containing protein, partial [Candidatus Sedimenticola sp. (ex Thyasira tokunagai)]